MLYTLVVLHLDMTHNYGNEAVQQDCPALRRRLGNSPSLIRIGSKLICHVADHWLPYLALNTTLAVF